MKQQDPVDVKKIGQRKANGKNVSDLFKTGQIHSGQSLDDFQKVYKPYQIEYVDRYAFIQIHKVPNLTGLSLLAVDGELKYACDWGCMGTYDYYFKDITDAEIQKAHAIRRKFRGYPGMTVIDMSGIHTVVPKGAVLHVPPKLIGMIVKKPKGNLMRWTEFLDKYSKYITIHVVTWETAKGDDPITEEERKVFVEEGKIVVAVFKNKKHPITVLESPPKKEPLQILHQ